MRALRVLFDRYLDSRASAVERADLDLPDRLALVRRYGDFSLAYSGAVQDKLAYFGDPDGYIAFGTKMSRLFALGDPVAEPARHPGLIERFVATGRDPWFIQVGENTARVLAGLGYQVNRLGVDTRLTLAAHDFSGKANETVRYSERWLLKQGYRFLEDHGGDAAPPDNVERLSSEWRSGRIVSRREMRFLNRRFEEVLGPGMRRFVLLDRDGGLVALLDFDPLFRDGGLVGYTTAFKRKRAGASSHAEIGLTKFAVDTFRSEGVALVTLGLSPLAAIEPSGFAESGFWRGAFQRASASPYINRRRFNLQGQAAFKRRFHGIEEPTYIAFRNATPVGMLGLLRLIKVL